MYKDPDLRDGKANLRSNEDKTVYLTGRLHR
jgi:hypothetical protein